MPVTKLKVCRLGITMASDAIEIHGGNGYIETWPVARLLRDAQVNTIWEGPDNILCLDVRRGIERAQAHEQLLQRLHDAVSVSDGDDTTALVSRRVDDLDTAITAWSKFDGAVAEARLFPLAQFMGDVYAGALLSEQAAWERAENRTDRKALVARLYAHRYLADPWTTSRLGRRRRRSHRTVRRAGGGRTAIYGLVSLREQTQMYPTRRDFRDICVCSPVKVTAHHRSVARKPRARTSRSSGSSNEVDSSFSIRRTR